MELVFAGQAMQPIRKLVEDVAGTPANVMICGESGTGKELVARSIHLLSSRKQAAFITLNCAAIPENLLESELFGHEKGAFTGAIQARQGKFELANHGTIFLDEIGEMPIGLQAKLLRVLQERVFERVGGNREIKVDVRIVAATNRDLQVEVTERRFREDLFYRLNVFPLQLPPLRDRLETLPQLVDFFVRKYSHSMGKPVTGVDAEALSAMKGYAWPGNVRELQNVIERAVILSQGNIGLGSLPESIRNRQAARPNESKAIIKSVEKEMIITALRKHSDNRRLTAAELGISRRALQYKLKEFELLDA
jgi:transcriptional regulator with PAS, ATPase and Fis domain